MATEYKSYHLQKFISEYFTSNNDGKAKDKDIHISHNMDYSSYQSAYQNFDRFYSIYPDLELNTLKPYVFIVRPDLNILDMGNPNMLSKDCHNDQFLQSMCNDHNIVLRHLTNTLDVNHDFMPFLVGRTESLQIPDYAIKSYSISQPYTNLLMPYAGNALESQTGGTFDITFREDHYLRVHKLFQTWLYYIDGVSRNLFKPKQEYIDYNKFDYACSVYYIICDVDGESILWWSKYTGCIPSSVPNSDLSFNLRGGIENRISIPFTYFMSKVLDPHILHDFNINSRNSDRSFIPVYDEDIIGTGQGIVGAPFIARKSGTNLYKLRWRTPKNV